MLGDQAERAWRTADFFQMDPTPVIPSGLLAPQLPDAPLLRLIADAASPLMAYYETPTLRCRFANQAYATFYGWCPATIFGRTLRGVVGESAWLLIADYLDQACAGQQVRYERERILSNGDTRRIQVDLQPQPGDDRVPAGLLVQIRDVTEQRQAQDLLRQGEERLRKFAHATEEGIVFHSAGLITDGNEAIERLLGYRVQEVLGRPVLDFMSDDTRHRVFENVRSNREEPYEAVVVRKDGRHVPVEIVGKTMPFGNETYRLAVVRDISARKEAQDRIAFMALHDGLTRLPNRAALEVRLASMVEHARVARHELAVLFLDLDHFKTINDSLGHHAGDLLLCEISTRLQSQARRVDAVARLGGDEFVVVLSDTDSRHAASVASQLLDAVGASMRIDGHTVSVSTSIGIGLYPGDGETADELLRRADTAMYNAKESGRRNYQFFVPAMSSGAIDALNQENLLRDALTRSQFALHYQPQIDMRDGRITGVEALIRWHHPTRGLVGPLEFIGFAEKRGLIAVIGRWVLEQACRQIKAWHDAGLAQVPVAVNLSAIEFRQRDLVPSIAAVLQTTGLAPRFLELELTESALMDQGSLIGEQLHALKTLGVRLAIDDFGTGYSSLAYLKRFPIDRLKIDRSFVRDTPADADDVAIVTAILQMARSLKLATVAEGVETAAQQALLRSLGCGDFQGFLVSRPLAPEAMAVFLRTHGPAGWRDRPPAPERGPGRALPLAG
jgi:diguanylate cyclase (GGDEF)-like protein/PAS domain S-box-containing protein